MPLILTQQKTETDMKTLRNVLLTNALTSGATGLALVAVPGLFADLFSTSLRSPFVGTGLFLMAFAAFVLMEERRRELNVSRVRLIIVLDTLWVVSSLFIIVSNTLAISAVGYFMIGAVALWVALMAYLQFVGLKKALIAH